MPDKSSDPGLNRACTVRLRSWICKTCNVGQITGIWSLSEKSARDPQRPRAFQLAELCSRRRANPPGRDTISRELTRRANHRLIATVGEISPRPEQVAGIFNSVLSRPAKFRGGLCG
jgi:hypothetical protein